MHPSAQLLERERELVEFDYRLRSIGPGQGHLLVVSGPAGLGKTSLLLELAQRARTSGLAVMRARGQQRETATPYGVARQLFDPMMATATADELDDLFVGRAGLARHLFEPDEVGPESTDSASATVQGLWWLLLRRAERQSLVLIVDDLQWCDQESLQWLAFLAHRVTATSVLLAVGFRAGDPAEDQAVLQDIIGQPDAVRLEPQPLAEASSRSLASAALGSALPTEVSAACHTATAGNPLLLWELLRALRGSGVAVDQLTPSDVQRIGARAATRPVTRQLAALPTEAGMLARAVAVLGDGTPLVQVAELAGLGTAAAEVAANRLAEAEVLRHNDAPEFVHPVVAEAVYRTIPPAARDAAHISAAVLLRRAGAHVHRVAAQVLLIPAGHYDDSVPVLREAATQAFQSGARASGVAYLRRALAENLDQELRGVILTDLGSAETLLDGAAAVTHLSEAAALTPDPVRRAEITVALGPALFFTQRNADAVAAYRHALARLPETVDRTLRQRLDAGLLAAAVDDSTLYPAARAHAATLSGLAPGECDPPLAAVLSWHEARTGGSSPRCVALAEQALSLPPGQDATAAFAYAGLVLAAADRYDEVRTLCNSRLEHATAVGSVFDFSIASWLRGIAAYFAGDLATAEADQRQAIEAGEAHGLSAGLIHGYARLADALVDQGQLAAAESTLDRVSLPVPLPPLAHFDWYLHSRGRLRLAQGRFLEALHDFQECGRRYASLGGSNPGFIPWRSEAALAELALGNEDSAQRLAQSEVDDARSWGAARPLGRALRVAGMADATPLGLELLKQSSEVLAESPATLEQARTAVELGIALHGTGEDRSAREQLWRGLEAAQRSGAVTLAERAHEALVRAGARPRRLSRSGTAALTPTELRVANLAADGRTNRELAEALFVTPKTIEMHLANAYRKLEIESRTQLSAALAE
ncbi:MAG: AAA family ATPase [Actinomycetota bacterium]|nr:AAA family ATPase [Actinomycetota bacterium]